MATSMLLSRASTTCVSRHLRQLLAPVCPNFQPQVMGKKKKKKKAGQDSEKEKLAKMGLAKREQKRHLKEVEMSSEKLVKYVVGLNYHVDSEPIKIKPNSEYPDWLWNLRTDREPVPLEELDKDSWAYWNRLRKIGRRNDMKVSKFGLHFRRKV